MTAAAPFKHHPAITPDGDIPAKLFGSREEAEALLAEIAGHYQSEILKTVHSTTAAAWRMVKGKRSRSYRDNGLTANFLEVKVYSGGFTPDGGQRWWLVIKAPACYEIRDKLREMISHPARPR